MESIISELTTMRITFNPDKRQFIVEDKTPTINPIIKVGPANTKIVDEGHDVIPIAEGRTTEKFVISDTLNNLPINSIYYGFENSDAVIIHASSNTGALVSFDTGVTKELTATEMLNYKLYLDDSIAAEQRIAMNTIVSKVVRGIYK